MLKIIEINLFDMICQCSTVLDEKKKFQKKKNFPVKKKFLVIIIR